jgi:hypothetical protein
VFGKEKDHTGEKHPDMLLSMNSLALLYYNQGQYDEARSLDEEWRERQMRHMNTQSGNSPSWIDKIY